MNGRTDGRTNKERNQLVGLQWINILERQTEKWIDKEQNTRKWIQTKTDNYKHFHHCNFFSSNNWHNNHQSFPFSRKKKTNQQIVFAFKKIDSKNVNSQSPWCCYFKLKLKKLIESWNKKLQFFSSRLESELSSAKLRFREAKQLIQFRQ